MGKLAERIAVITAGTSGIVLATATPFVKDGVYVFIFGRDETERSAAI